MWYINASGPEIAITLVTSIIYTLLLYGLGPVIYAKTRTQPVTIKQIRRFSIIYTVCMCFLNAGMAAVAGGRSSGGSAAMIWGTVFYGCAKRILYKKNMIQTENDNFNERE